MKNSIKNSIEVTVGRATRSVVVNTEGPHYSTGYVGEAYFCWKSDLFELPYVKLKGQSADLRTRQLVKLFLMEYKSMLMATKKSSPMHFNESEGSTASSSCSKSSNAISGVPHWMREDHKEWKECKRKDGSTYMRRTRFKPESKDIVEEYLPHCSGCVFRVNCSAACADPDLMSRSDIFQSKDVTEAEEVADAV
ncbi:hypothetical protein [Bacillus atrophaeus]|uniref:hypothetical protein n=1 Tax=Bacillus atrophaeus TaxID=1452 RepID=UPI002E2397C5|nr:hypothetical protein [Bacillus atrophaeus]